MKHKEWLLDELPELRRAGILDEDAAERLRRHYSGDSEICM